MKRVDEFRKKLDELINEFCNRSYDDIAEELEFYGGNIRERLIAFLSKCKAVYGDSFQQFDLNIDEALAWLEKQGKTSPILSNSLNIGKVEQEQFLEVEIPFGAKDSDLQEASYNIPTGYHAEIEDNKVVIKKGEQKHLSEEDKKKLNRIYMLLAEAADEHAFSTTCRLIGDKECVDLQDFLKSLMPQSTWKPSATEIKVLEEVIDLRVNPINYHATLHGILEQLKKL